MYDGNLQPKNLVRRSDGSYVIVDLGLGHHDDTNTAAFVARSAYATREGGRSLDELVAGRNGAAYTSCVDVYQAAQVIWFALTGRHPATSASTAAELQGLPGQIRTLAASTQVAGVLRQLPGLGELLPLMLEPQVRARHSRTGPLDVCARLRVAVAVAVTVTAGVLAGRSPDGSSEASPR